MILQSVVCNINKELACKYRRGRMKNLEGGRAYIAPNLDDPGVSAPVYADLLAGKIRRNHQGGSLAPCEPVQTLLRSVVMDIKHSAVAIVPCNDLDASQAFYEQLGFHATSIYPHHGYRILHDAKGASIHLTRVDRGSVDPERNAHGIYFYAEDAEALAAALGCTIERKPWGLIEFAISDPNGTLVRIGWPCEGAGE